MAGGTLVIGGYTPGGVGGLAVVSVDDNRFGMPRLAAAADNPSFVVASPDGRFVYATLERAAGAVAAWRVASDGQWPALGERSTDGAHPCHLALSPSGRFLLAANYTSGSVSVHPVDDDGSLGERADLVQHTGPVGPVGDRQDGRHAHQVVFVATTTVLVCDLGLDAVLGYELDESTGRLTEVARSPFPPGTGPRHLALSPDRAAAYVVGELTSTVTACAVDGARVRPGHVVSSRGGGAHRVGQNIAAAVATSVSGRHTVVTNRGDDTVVTFENAPDGTLRYLDTIGSGGHWPRFAGWGPDNTLVVANERSDAVALLERSDAGWTLLDTLMWPSPTVVAALPTP